MVERAWRVLLIGGPSGAGKTAVARQLGLQLGASWLQADDIRLAFQRARARLPDSDRALDYFIATPDAWSQPPERLCDALIAVGDALAPALEVIVENHVDTDAPIIIEGDSVLPSLMARAPIRERAARGFVRAVFIVEDSEAALLANMRARGRGFEAATDAERRVEARTKWLFSRWIEREAERYGLPAVVSRPWDTLAARALAACGQIRREER
jgi:2-phosphoglycerate kinase